MTGAHVTMACRPALTHGDILRGKPCSPLPAFLGPPCLEASVGLFARSPDAFHRAGPRAHIILGAGLCRWMPDAGVAISPIVLDVSSNRRRLRAPSVAIPDRLGRSWAYLLAILVGRFAAIHAAMPPRYQ